MKKTTLAKLRRLSKAPAIIGWLLILKPILQLIGQASDIDFTIGAGSNPRLVAIWNFFATPKGNIILIALGFLWLGYLVVKPTKDTDASERTTPEAPQRAAPAQSRRRRNAPAESALNCVNTRIINIALVYDVYMEMPANKDVRAAVIAFRNGGNAASMENYVKARITFYDSNGNYLHHVNNGVWLKEEEKSIQFFDVGEVRELVIACVMPDGEVYALDKEDEQQGLTFTGQELHVEVSLVGGIVPGPLGSFKFKLTLQPSLMIEEIKPTLAASQ